MMKIDLHRLEQVAVEESKAERTIATDRKDNGDMYKASFRIAMKIKRALRIKHMTQAHLSELMGVDPAIVSRYLSGKANMELKTIVKIEKALDINIIDREISPKKKKEVIILSNAFENMESFSHNNDDENFIHKLYASTNANMNRFSDIWHFSNETSSEFMVLPQKERIRKTSKESKIKFLEVV
ncbi:helix-turn-helix domain-containing protein [Sangeribacter muris]|mgnify:CR=1 FL=1|uniref:helix-turn-helix domain-containing protein n=1 Tax=Sangeribacter muris TaxID=2880703 RepID=UPI00244DF359|nr:helix-turn-helix transcriptional regulator [Sangeribacter muris]